MDQYITHETAYRLLAGRLLAAAGVSAITGSDGNSGESNGQPSGTTPSASAMPFLGSPASADYSAPVFPSGNNTSYNNSGNSSSASNAGGLLLLNNSHDSNNSIVNSPASATDHSGSFSAGTPGSVTGASNLVGNNNLPQRGLSSSTLPGSVSGTGMFSSPTPSVADQSLLQNTSIGGGGPRRIGKQGGGAQCPECDKRFNNSSALAKHKLIHSQERRYACLKCGKGFKRQDHLSGHMMTHEDQKPYKCYVPGCDKSYCDSRSLRRHLENHHGEHIESPFICPPVYSQSTDKDGQRQQQQQQQAKLEPFFSYEDDRVRQIAEATSDQGNSNMSDCVGRQQHFSPITPANNAPAARRPNERNSRASISIVSCSLCSKKFRSVASLNGHMRIHGPRRVPTGIAANVRDELDSTAMVRNHSPSGMPPEPHDRHPPLTSTSSCVFTHSPMPNPLQQAPPLQQHPQPPLASRHATDRFIHKSAVPLTNSFNGLADTSRTPGMGSVTSADQDNLQQLPQHMAQPMRQSIQSTSDQQQSSGPLDLAFGNGIPAPGDNRPLDYRQRVANLPSSMNYLPPPIPQSQTGPPTSNNPSTALALAMMKAALPGSFDPLNMGINNPNGVDPRNAWLSLCNSDPSTIMAAQMAYQQQQQQQQQQQPLPQQQQQHLPSNAAITFSGSGAPFQAQCQAPPKFTVPQSPGSFIRSRFAQQQYPASATSWTPFPNQRQPPQMKDIATSPFVTIPKERQVFFPPDNDDQTSGCLSTQPQCSPSTPGTISVVGDHPPLSAGIISVVGTPPQRSPAVMYGTPGNSGAQGTSGSDLPPCRMMSTTPCSPQPMAVNPGNKNNTCGGGLLVPATRNLPKQHNRQTYMMPPTVLPPPPPGILRNKPKMEMPAENDENHQNHHQHSGASPIHKHNHSHHHQQQQDDKEEDRLSDLDSSPELFEHADFDPQIYLRSPPQTAPPVLFAGGTEIDVKKLRHFSFDDCDVEKLTCDTKHERDLCTPSPPPDDQLRAIQQPLPSPGFKSPAPFVALQPQQPQRSAPAVVTAPIAVESKPQPMLVTNTMTPPTGARMEPANTPLSSTSSVLSTSNESMSSTTKKRNRPPPLPIINSNFGTVSQLRSYVDGGNDLSSATSSLCSTGTVSSASTVSSESIKTFPARPERLHSTLSASNKPATVSMTPGGSFVPPYTPPPILSPFRLTPGTFWALKQAKTPVDSALTASTASSVFFNEAATPLSDRRPRINVGPQFQAEIPPYRKPSLAMRDADCGELMFAPTFLSNVSESNISALCELARSSAAGSPHGSNIELVMHLLSATGGSIENVTRLLLNTSNDTNDNGKLPTKVASYRYQENAVWTAEEIRLFISIVGQLKKDFWQISKKMGTKSVKECIEFYYLWKRLFSELTPPPSNGEPPAKRACLNPVSSSDAARSGKVLPDLQGDNKLGTNCHTTARQNLLFCDFCPKVFDKKRAKSFHMKIYHTNSNCSSHMSPTINVAASLLASSPVKSTCCQLVFSSPPASSPSTNMQTAQVAQ